MIIAAEIREEIDTPLANSHTFLTLRHEEWAIQDFLPMAPATADTYPSRGEMKLLRAARWTHLGLVLAVLACWAWIGMSMLEMVRRPEWTFNEDQARSVKMKLQMLQKERSRIGHWDNLLEDRSKGWTSMEMLTRFFPEESGFLLRSFQHSVSPEAVRGKKELGFVKQWQIGGFAREASLPRLTELGTREGISKAFDEVAKITGSHAYRTDLPTRSVIVNIKTLENASYKPRPPEEFIMTDESSYPFVFDLTITQRFEADDPLALSTSAAP
jgi:hypothetical protein